MAKWCESKSQVVGVLTVTRTQKVFKENSNYLKKKKVVITVDINLPEIQQG